MGTAPGRNHGESSKLQHPSFRKAPSSKFQTAGPWILGQGAWNAEPRLGTTPPGRTTACRWIDARPAEGGSRGLKMSFHTINGRGQLLAGQKCKSARKHRSFLGFCPGQNRGQNELNHRRLLPHHLDRCHPWRAAGQGALRVGLPGNGRWVGTARKTFAGGWPTGSTCSKMSLHTTNGKAGH
jgi:hypothetical protein